MFWDISLSEEWNTTPWDVRENATILDVVRLNVWNRARRTGQQEQKMIQQLQSRRK